MWPFRWFSASLPAALVVFTFGTSLGLLAAGTAAALMTGFVLSCIFWICWGALAFLPMRFTTRFWGASEDQLLERDWFRAFDEQGSRPPESPLFLVCSEPAPIFLAWSLGLERRAILVSRAWLESTGDFQKREMFRRAFEKLSERGLRWRTAHTWFVILVLKRFSRGVQTILWEESGSARVTVFEWVTSLPWVAWLIWSREFIDYSPAPQSLEVNMTQISKTPLDLSRRAAASLMAVDRSGSAKTILSFTLTD